MASNNEASGSQSEEYWEALEIVDEDRTRYKVKWAGIDPQTGEPWEDSWTLKAYVTPDLKQVWIKKKKLAAQTKQQKRKSSASTRKSRGTSASTTSTRTKTKRTLRSSPEDDHEEAPSKVSKGNN